jgi:ribonuclease J
VPVGRLGVEGGRLVPLEGETIRARSRMREAGALLATVALDRRGRLVGEPRISAPGLVDGADDNAAFRDRAAAAVADAVAEFGRGDPDELIEEAARRALARVAKAALGRRPQIEVHVVRV